MANGKQYSRQELQEILDVALSKQSQPGDFGEAELLETARELGLSPEQVAAAEAEITERRELKVLVDAAKRSARKSFTSHLLSYVLVNAGLLAVNVLEGAPWWFQWPLLGWGLAVAVHVVNLVRTSEAEWQAFAIRQRDRERRKAQRYQAKQQLEQRVVELFIPSKPTQKGQGERALDQAVDEAVDRALGVAAQVIQRVSQPRERNDKKHRD